MARWRGQAVRLASSREVSPVARPSDGVVPALAWKAVMRKERLRAERAANGAAAIGGAVRIFSCFIYVSVLISSDGLEDLRLLEPPNAPFESHRVHR